MKDIEIKMSKAAEYDRLVGKCGHFPRRRNDLKTRLHEPEELEEIIDEGIRRTGECANKETDMG